VTVAIILDLGERGFERCETDVRVVGDMRDMRDVRDMRDMRGGDLEVFEEPFYIRSQSRRRLI
jgi:hypothetical protein